MNNTNIIQGFFGKNIDGKKSLMPAKLDFMQSASGLILALFMWAHMIFVSSILLGKDAMYTITKLFEGSFIWGYANSKPWLVSIVAGIIFAIFILHACLAMRKLPAKFRQWQIFRTHKELIHHGDTTYWWFQAITGIVLFFFGSAHVFMMMTMPENIGPFASAERMWHYGMWPFYLILLFAVEIHGTVGLYRLAVKWGWFDGKDYKATRKRLQIAKSFIGAFLLILGLASMAAYVKIGYENRNLTPGTKYEPHKMTNMQNINMPKQLTKVSV